MMSSADDGALRDFQRWVVANGGQPFSLWDYLQAVLTERNVHPDVSMAFCDLFWPDLVEKDDCVFVKSQFSAQKLEELSKQNVKGGELEYWMNILLLDELIPNASDECVETLGRTLAATWAAKVASVGLSSRYAIAYREDASTGDRYIEWRRMRHTEVP